MSENMSTTVSSRRLRLKLQDLIYKWQYSHWKQINYTSELKFRNMTTVTWFLQRVSIACSAKRCISYRKSVCLSVCLSVRLFVRRWHCVKTTPATIMRSSQEDSPMTLVSSWLTLPQNSKGNTGCEGAKWERGRKNREFLANKSP